MSETKFALKHSKELSPDRELDLAVRNLSKSFDSTRRILDGINLEVARGESVALIGANGCGKSTLLKSCLGLMPWDDGEVTLLGEKTSGISRRKLRHVRSKVGLVFQRHNLVPRLNALTNVVHGVLGRTSDPRNWLQCTAPKKNRDAAYHCLEQVNLQHLAKRRADTLSGGESQRVAIARALMQEPRMILADEPVASLDPKVGREVMELFVELARSRGITLLYVSHHLDDALEFADRIVGLRSGKIEFNASPGDLTKLELEGFYE